MHFIEDILSSLDRNTSRKKIKNALSKINLHEEQIIWVYERIGVFLRPFVDWGNAFTENKIYPGSIGYCGLAFTNMGVLSNGEAVICCGDYDGKTAIGNLNDDSMVTLLLSEEVKDIIDGFKRFKLVHPHCRKCLGASNRIMALIKGLASVYLFKIKSVYKPRSIYLSS